MARSANSMPSDPSSLQWPSWRDRPSDRLRARKRPSTSRAPR